MNQFDIKDPAEKVVLTFDFSDGLAVGETLTGTPTVTVAMALGSDATPAALLNGAAALDGSEKMVLVPVQAGIDRCEYLIKVVVATSNAQKILTLKAVLPVNSTAN